MMYLLLNSLYIGNDINNNLIIHNNGYRRITRNAAERADVGTIIENKPTLRTHSCRNNDKTTSRRIQILCDN